MHVRRRESEQLFTPKLAERSLVFLDHDEVAERANAHVLGRWEESGEDGGKPQLPSRPRRFDDFL